MPEYLILKLEGESPRDAQIISHVISDDEPHIAAKQGYTGDGRYAIVNWDERVECDLSPGAVRATGVQDRAKREELTAKAEPEAPAE